METMICQGITCGGALTIQPILLYRVWFLGRGPETYLSSWRSNDDPASIHLDPAGYPQVITKRGAVTQYRMGPWNGVVFSGLPDPRSNPGYKLGMYKNKEGVFYHREDVMYRSARSRYTLNQNGVGHRWLWVDQKREWFKYLSIPADNCDTYRLCGAYGCCNIGMFPVCWCLDRFVPKDPEGWSRAAWSSGCIRRKPFNCRVGDGFLKYSGIKLPDARTSWYNESMSLKECKEECLRNCSCTAYTNLNISEGSEVDASFGSTTWLTLGFYLEMDKSFTSEWLPPNWVITRSSATNNSVPSKL